MYAARFGKAVRARQLDIAKNYDTEEVVVYDSSYASLFVGIAMGAILARLASAKVD